MDIDYLGEILSWDERKRNDLMRRHGQILADIRSGHFDREDPLHAVLGYGILQRQWASHPTNRWERFAVWDQTVMNADINASRIPFHDYLDQLQHLEETDYLKRYDEKERMEIACLAYEQTLWMRALAKIKMRWTALRTGTRRLLKDVLVRNSAYGWIAAAGLEKEIREMGFVVMDAKAASADGDYQPFAVYGDREGRKWEDGTHLLRARDLDCVIREERSVVVLDGNRSHDRGHLQHGHEYYPCSHFIWANNVLAWSGEVSAGNAGIQDMEVKNAPMLGSSSKGNLITMVLNNPWFHKLREKIEKIKPAETRGNYRMYFWYPGQIEMERRTVQSTAYCIRSAVDPALDLVNYSDPGNPRVDKMQDRACLFLSAAVEDAMMPAWIRTPPPPDVYSRYDWSPRDPTELEYHNSGYWSDRGDKIRKFDFRVTPRGPRLVVPFEEAVHAEYLRIRKIQQEQQHRVEDPAEIQDSALAPKSRAGERLQNELDRDQEMSHAA